MRHKVFSALLCGSVVVCLSLVCGVPADCAVVHVKPSGWDGNDGLTWETAKRSVTAGLEAAEPLDEVWVAKGTYLENIILAPCVALYGGFGGTETSRSQRLSFPRPTPDPNEAVLDGQQKGSVVISPPGAPASTRLDGFTIRNGSGTWVSGPYWRGGGVYCEQSSPTIANNSVTGNTLPDVPGDGAWGGGIYCGGDCSPSIRHNLIAGNSATTGGGVVLKYCSAVVEDNVIAGNTAVYEGGGISASSYYPLLLARNRVVANTTAGKGGGIALWAVHCLVISNIIADNSATSGGSLDSQAGAGVQGTLSGWCSFVNNTVVGNHTPAPGGGGGIYCGHSGVGPPGLRFSNNIIALNSSGLSVGGAVVLSHNDVWQNTAYNYSGLPPGATDISADPTFVDAVNGDYHLRLISPCINAGSNADVGPGWFDMDGEVRALPDGEVVDIGADEYSAHAVWSPANAKKVVPDGAEAVIKGRNRQAMVTTARLPDVPAFYVEQADRSVGLQCRGSSLLEPGQAALLLGIMGTIDWERVLTDAVAVDGSLRWVGIPGALTVPSRSLGGGPFGLQQGISGAFGLNNIGLLIKTAGTVTYAEGAFFYLDDGSVLDDHSGHIGVKVYGAVPVNPGEEPVGKFVTVTGISGCEIAGSDLVRVIRTRDAQDVVVLR